MLALGFCLIQKPFLHTIKFIFVYMAGLCMDRIPQHKCPKFIQKGGVKVKKWCFIYVAVVILSILFLSGCSGSSSSLDTSVGSDSTSIDGDVVYDYDMKAEPGEIADTNSGETGNSVAGEEGLTKGAKLIRNVDISMETTKYSETVKSVKRKVREFDGWIQNSDMNHYSDMRTKNVTIRLPYKQVDKFLEEIGEYGTVQSVSDNTRDITLQYADSETRLKNLKTQHKRLLELLETAERLEDIISLEDRLSQVESEIDTYSMEIRNYDDLVDYSTVNISITEKEHITETDKTFIGRVVSGLSDNLYSLRVAFVDFAVYAIVHIPNFIILCILVLIASKISKVMNKRKKK